MRKTRNALLGILTMMSGAILAVPTDAAERYIPGGYVYKSGPERLFSYPYGGTHLRVDYAKRRFGYPYVGSYYGNYYAPNYAYSYVLPYRNYYEPLYLSYYGYSSTCYRSSRCSRSL